MNDCNQYSFEPFFLPFGQELIFCVFLAPEARTPRASVLYLHPFAEEMHKSRRMAALQARQFAAEGYAVLQIDLLGCGDSTGDFEEASWEKWIACVREAYTWLYNKTNLPIVLWGLRLGATLAAHVSYQFPNIAGLILWQPVTNGESYLNQFLRIKVASDMLSSNQQQSGTKQLLKLIAEGESVEIGGYMLSPELASDIGKLLLINYYHNFPVYWFEVSNLSTQTLSPASLKVINVWNNSSRKINIQTIYGEPFWNSQEIVECPDLLTQTTKAISILVP
jgi:exosortase A-associated hydrolase 2